MRSAEGDRESYVELLRESLDVDPAYSRSLLSLAVWYADAGQPAEAEPVFERLLEHHPYHLRGHYNYGVLLLRQGIWDKAESHLLEAIELGPDYIPSYLALLASHVDLGDRQGADRVRARIQERFDDEAVRSRADELMEMM
jgi:Tfp pilus assembly protein PilF